MPKANDSNPKSHHFVPRFLLNRFAKDKRLVRIERNPRHPNGFASPRTACTVDDFYRLESPSEPDPLRIERAMATDVEGPAAQAIEAIVTGEFPPSQRVREALNRFAALQVVRGPDIREFLNAPFEVAVRVAERFTSRPRATEMLRRIGYPIADDSGALAKDALINLQADLARTLVTMSWMRLALVRFDTLSLITSDRPMVHWGKLALDARTTVGIDVPHSLSLHLDPRHALLFVPRDFHLDTWVERVVDGTPDIADTLNHRAAWWASDRVFHHPDQVLRGLDRLPHRVPIRDELFAAMENSLELRSWPIRKLGRWLLLR